MKKLSMLFAAACLSLGSFAQEKIYLNENFNKQTIASMPPYGWSMIDADGDGQCFSASQDGDNKTIGAGSWSWLFGDYYPDNWLITPRLYVEKATDSLSYWLGSYLGQTQHCQVWISKKKPQLADFTTLMDSVTFKAPIDQMTRKISLKDFVGDTIYIAFRHKDVPMGASRSIGLVVDNVQGPQMVPLQKELAVEEIISFHEMACDVTDARITAVIRNLGLVPMSNINIYTQSGGSINNDGKFYGSEILSETITRTINPGDSIHHTFSSPLPFSTYDNFSSVYIRVVIDELDDYKRNDTLQSGFYKQGSFKLPLKASFEEEGIATTDTGYANWSLGELPPAADLMPFGIGTNPNWAKSGVNYLAASAYAPIDGMASSPRSGDDACVRTRCLYLESDKDYRVDLYYAFRKFPAALKDKHINFRLLVGKNQHDLLEEHEVLFDSKLLLEGPMVVDPNAKAPYSLFSSDKFKVGESGTYYMGLMFYSDHLVENKADEWMIFVDDFYLSDASVLLPADISLEAISAPYDCNLTDSEEVTFSIKNVSNRPVFDIEAAYKVNNGTLIKEMIADTIAPNTSYTHTFKTFADFSTYRKYKIEGKLSIAGEENIQNNELMVYTENTNLLKLPFIDGFEDYGSILNFEDYYRVVKSGDYTWDVGYDNTPDTLFAYKGRSFLVDAYDTERYAGPNDWLIGRCIQFQKDTTYRISFAYRLEKADVKINGLKAVLLSSYNTESVKKELFNEASITNAQYKVFSCDYTATEDHIAHLAFKSQGNIGGPIIMMDEFIVSPLSSLVGVEKTQSVNISVYPNPAKENVHIQTSENIKRVELVNIFGNLVYAQELGSTSNTANISVANYSQGVYMLVIHTSKGNRVTQKLIIHK